MIFHCCGTVTASLSFNERVDSNNTNLGGRVQRYPQRKFAGSIPGKRDFFLQSVLIFNNVGFNVTWNAEVVDMK